MSKNINVKNVKEYAKKVIMYIKNHKVTSNRNVNNDTNKPNKEKIYKSNKYIKMCKKYINIYIYIYIYIQT